MNKDHERRIRRLAAVGALMALVSACGGSGGGATPAQPPAPTPPPPPPSAYLLSEFVASSSSDVALLAWDPAQPLVAAARVPLVADANGALQDVSTRFDVDAVSVDSTGTNETLLGHAGEVFASAGHVWTLDLHGGQTPVPMQHSTLGGGSNLLAGVFPLEADGSDAWILVRGPDQQYAVRTTMAATDAPVPLEEGGNLLTVLPDSAGHVQYLVGVTGRLADSSLTIFDRNMARTTGSDATMQEVSWVALDPAAPGHGFIALNPPGAALFQKEIRSITWDASGVQVGTTALRVLQSLNISSDVTADASAQYLLDGGVVLAAANGAVSVVGTFPSVSASDAGLGDQLTDAGEYLVEQRSTDATGDGCCTEIDAMRKSDGTVTVLASGPAAAVSLVGATGQWIVINTTTPTGDALVKLHGDGTGAVTLGANAGVIRSATALVAALPRRPIVSVVTCSGNGGSVCAAGNLVQTDIDSGTSTILGSFAPSGAHVAIDAVAGLSSSFGVSSWTAGSYAGQRDAWQFTPGSAGSLVRISSNLN